MPLDLKALHEERQARAAAKRKLLQGTAATTESRKQTRVTNKDESSRAGWNVLSDSKKKETREIIDLADSDSDNGNDDNNGNEIIEIDAPNNVGRNKRTQGGNSKISTSIRKQPKTEKLCCFTSSNATATSSDAALAALLQQQFDHENDAARLADGNNYNDDAKLASLLQAEECGKHASYGTQQQLQVMSPDGREGSAYLLLLAKAMDETRMSCEGPPEATPVVTQIDRNGTLQRLRPATRPWSDTQPCVECDDIACLLQLSELGVDITSFRNAKDPSAIICKHPANAKMLRFLCSWRKHVKETFIETKKAGAKNWSKRSICTSELTFLGRKYSKGGVIGCVALATIPIDSIPALYSLSEQQQPNNNHPLKALSPGFAMLVALKFHWPFTEEVKKLWNSKVAKLRQISKEASLLGNGSKKYERGAEIWQGSPWGLVYDHIQASTPVPSLLRHSVLSRAHLP